MKDKWLNNLIKEARQTKLTREEKQTMLSAILGGSYIPSPYQFSIPSFIHTYHRQAVALVVIFVLVVSTGGTSFAAEKALPGEVLYSIKVNVNEEIQSFVAFSPNAKARVGIERTTKRLKEAEKLAEEGRLTPEAQGIIKAKIKSHGEDIKANLAVLASSDSTTTAKSIVSDFRASVEAISPSTPIATSSELAVDSIVSKNTSDNKTDVSADAQAIGLLSITEELKAELVIIEETLASTTAAATPSASPPTDSQEGKSSTTATSTLPVLPTTPVASTTISVSTSSSPVLRVQ